MNELENNIRNDLTTCMKDRDQDVVNALRMILGEIPRLNLKVNESATNDQIIGIIKKLIKSETETLKMQGKDVSKSFYINVLNRYLPKMVTEDQIIKYIKENIDFSVLKNKMQAIGIVNKHFGSLVDGKMIAKIVQTKF